MQGVKEHHLCDLPEPGQHPDQIKPRCHWEQGSVHSKACLESSCAWAGTGQDLTSPARALLGWEREKEKTGKDLSLRDGSFGFC